MKKLPSRSWIPVWEIRDTAAWHSAVQVFAAHPREVGVERQRVGIAPTYSPREVIASRWFDRRSGPKSSLFCRADAGYSISCRAYGPSHRGSGQVPPAPEALSSFPVLFTSEFNIGRCCHSKANSHGGWSFASDAISSNVVALPGIWPAAVSNSG